MAITQPAFIPQPWAGGNSAYRAVIPDNAAAAAAGRASWETGYPPSTSTPLEAGGYAPARLDFNGGLYALSAHVFFQQSGNIYAWSETLDYNIGATVLGEDGIEYRCIAVNGISGTVVNPVNDVNHTAWKPLTLFLTDIIYPVGSIYQTTAMINPGSVFGGTWRQINGRFLLASDAANAAGATGGSQTQILSVQNMPTHFHGTGSLATVSAGGHTHEKGSLTSASAGAHTHTASTSSAGVHTHTISGTTANAGAHTHTRGTMEISGVARFMGSNGYTTIKTAGGAFSTAGDQVGGNTASNASSSLNQYCDLNFTASKNWTGLTSSAGAHTHTVSGVAASAGAHTHTLTTSSAGTHTHIISGTTASAGAHTHTISGSTASSGGNTAFSIMPPYLIVNMWVRIA